jgi:hypothetical protein
MKLNELSKLNREYITVKIGTKEVEISSWRTKDEKAYLNMLENAERNNKVITDQEIYNVLIKPVIKEDIVLSSNEQKMLLIEIRKISISDEIKDSIKCDKCSSEINISNKIDDIVSFLPSNFRSVNIDDITFVFGDIKRQKDKAKMNIEDGLVNYIFTEFLLHISEIHYQDNIFKYGENMNYIELQDFIDSLNTNTFDKLFEEYHTMIDSLEMKVQHKCECSNIIIKEYNSLPGFLWI